MASNNVNVVKGLPYKMPEKISEASKVINVSSSEQRSYVVFKRLMDVAVALEKFENNALDVSENPTKRLFADAAKDSARNGSDPSLTVGMLGLGMAMGQRNRVNFTDRIIEGAIKTEKKSPEAYCLASNDFEYEALGTNFFKSSISIFKEENRYLLSMNLSYTGDEVETKIAKANGTYRALRSANIDVTYTNVDKFWFNIDISPYARVFDLNLEATNIMASAIVKLGSPVTKYKMENNKVRQIFDYNGSKMAADFQIPEVKSNYALPGYVEGTEIKQLIKSEGTRILGGSSWSRYSAETERLEPGTVIVNPPKFTITVGLAEKFSAKTTSVYINEDEIKLVLEAKDHLQKLIADSLRA